MKARSIKPGSFDCILSNSGSRFTLLDNMVHFLALHAHCIPGATETSVSVLVVAEILAASEEGDSGI